MEEFSLKNLPDDIPVEIRIDDHTLQRDMTPHWHDAAEINLIMEGTGKYYVNSTVLDVEPEDIFLFGVSQIHRSLADDERRFKVLLVYFDPQWVWKDVGEDDIPLDERNLFRTPMSLTKVSAGSQVNKKMTQLLNLMYEEIKDRGIGYKLNIKAFLLSLLTLIFREQIGSSADGFIVSKDDINLSRLRNLLNYVRMHYSEKITVQQAANLCFLSPSYFAHLFHRITGLTFGSYLGRYRIDRAKHFLQTSDNTISAISNMIGYESYSHFYYTFQKYVGMKPSEFRKHHQKNNI